MKNIFEQIRLFTVLIQGINTICGDKMPTFHISMKVHSLLVSEFSTAYHTVSCVLRTERHNLKQH
jgi:hypothetical protein